MYPSVVADNHSLPVCYARMFSYFNDICMGTELTEDALLDFHSVNHLHLDTIVKQSREGVGGSMAGGWSLTYSYSAQI